MTHHDSDDKNDDGSDKGYREQTIHALCRTCGEAALGSCVDCNEPFCNLHRPHGGDRCADCLLEHRRGRGAVQAALLGLVGALLLNYLYWMSPPTLAAVGALWGGLAAQMAAVVLALVHGLKSRRRRALAIVALCSLLTVPVLSLAVG